MADGLIPFLADDTGSSLVEYIVITALILAACVAALGILSHGIMDFFTALTGGVASALQ